MNNQRAVGIDLGTTYSVVAWIDNGGRTAVIPNREGDALTPSVVLFNDDEVIVGKSARKIGVLKPRRFAACAKRDMGNPVYSRELDGVFLPPEVVQACVLRKVTEDARDTVGRDAAVVITVPAFFDEPRRLATALAGQMAGIEVLDIVNEPTAAALAFGEQTGIIGPGGSAQGEMTILVYDLGGGTFDTTLVKISGQGFRTIATDGDVRLGGRDWDQRLLDLVSDEFVKQHREDPRSHPSSVERLWAEVECGKHSLTMRQRATIRVDHAGVSADIEVSRDTFEETTADLLERTAHTTREVLATAGIERQQLSMVLLVGGASRMPMVSRMLEDELGQTPRATISADEAVARGAAIFAQHLLDSRAPCGRRSPLTITNVNAHSLGIKGVERDTNVSVNTILIPRNSPLPASVSKTFVTIKENQRSIEICVLEGESTSVHESPSIGRTFIRGLPASLPKGHPVEVTFDYSTNGRLNVYARVAGTDKEAELHIDRRGEQSVSCISNWREIVCGDSGFRDFAQAAEELLQQQSAASKWSAHEDSCAVALDEVPNSGASGEVVPDVADDHVVDSEMTDVVSRDRGIPWRAFINSLVGWLGRLRPRRRTVNNIVFVVGHVVFSVLGLAIGWYVLHRFNPLRFPMPQFIPQWLQQWL